MVRDASAFEKIDEKYIAKISYKSVYALGLRYYRRGRVKSVVYGKRDPGDFASSDPALFIRTTVAETTGDTVYATEVYDNGHLYCDCGRLNVCRHTVAAMCYIHDPLEDILSKTPVRFISSAREREERRDAKDAADDLGPHDPAADFEEWLREEQYDKVAAMRRLKVRIANRASRLSMLIETEKPRKRIEASKSVFVLYLEYLQTRMLEHADTSRKRSAHLKFLTREYTRNLETDEVAAVYRQSLASLYKIDAAWRKSVTASLESTLPYDDYDDGGWGYDRPVFANDVLPYAGVLEAAGVDASKIFEKYHKESATICHEYARYLVRVKKHDKAKSVKSDCRKRFGKKTREPHDDYL